MSGYRHKGPYQRKRRWRVCSEWVCRRACSQRALWPSRNREGVKCISRRTRVSNAVLLADLHRPLRLCELCWSDHFHWLGMHRLSLLCETYKTFARTFVIFSMFLTDLRRNSSSRKVAMRRTCACAVSTVGCAEATRRTERVRNDMGEGGRGGYFREIFQSRRRRFGQPRTYFPTHA